MISIIICSRDEDISQKLKENINTTIGVDYELIIIDSTKSKYTIFQAYNHGANLAKYPILCFMHDDILFHTKGWGKKVYDHFENKDVGIIGVAGSHYMPKMPGAYWSCGVFSINVVQNTDDWKETNFLNYLNNHKHFIRALTLDGLWFCIPRKVMQEVAFDEFTFKGFHCYDSDICLQIINLNLEARVVFDIEIEHFSLGNRDDDWLKNIFLLYKKWKHLLPISAFELSEIEKAEAHYQNARELIEISRSNKFGIVNILFVWFLYVRLNPPFNKQNINYSLSLLKRTFSHN